MRTPKKVWKDIAGKLKNRKSTSAAKEATVEKQGTMPEDVKDSLEMKEQTNVDKATETDTQSHEDINENSEDLQPICESGEEAQNSSIETATPEPNAHDSPSSAEIEPWQAILAGSASLVLLVSGVALYIMKMPEVAVVVGIVGLAYAGFALYNSFKPNTKLEKVENIEQSIIANPSLNLT